MTAFIIISTTDSLNRFVDDITACRPQNPMVAAETHIGTGKLLQKDDGLYYHYTYGNGTANDSNESDLSKLLANQIANFRLQANLGESELQVFVLENPITEEENSRSELVHDALRKVIAEKKYENNCHVIRVLFSYDVSSSDVTKQVAHDQLLQILNNEAYEQEGIRSHILYFDNQDRNGAAITSNKEEHDLLVSRMLCDFMMLYSSENNSYNVRNVAHNNETRMFSFGYAECMYYFKDVERYYRLAYNRDIRKYYLHCPNETENLSYEQSPLGLIERRTRLAPRYADVAYNEDIDKHGESVDKQIDDIIRANKGSIRAIKEQALEEAWRKDEEETTSKRQEAIDKGEDPEAVKTITRHTEAAQAKYPDYRDRRDLYKSWLVEHTDEDCFDNTLACHTARMEYERLIRFVQLPEYRQFVLNVPILVEEEPHVDVAHTPAEKKGCNLFVRWFYRERPQPSEQPQPNEPASKTDGRLESVEKIASIAALLDKKAQYKKLCNYINQVEMEIREYQEQMDNFHLTKHSKSVGNLIDLNILKKHQAERAQQHIEAIIQHWRNRQGTLSDLMKETERECTNDVVQYKFINWDEPFVFVKKDVDIRKLSIELHQRATPFVQAYTIRPVKENLTSYVYYHDREDWQRDIDNKTIEIPFNTSSELSTHIESKFCLFQILQMDGEIINGLADLNTMQDDTPL